MLNQLTTRFSFKPCLKGFTYLWKCQIHSVRKWSFSFFHLKCLCYKGFCFADKCSKASFFIDRACNGVGLDLNVVNIQNLVNVINVMKIKFSLFEWSECNSLDCWSYLLNKVNVVNIMNLIKKKNSIFLKDPGSIECSECNKCNQKIFSLLLNVGNVVNITIWIDCHTCWI